MTLKWGSTTCTAIKWGSTTCTAVYWGSTLVWPDYSYPIDQANTWVSASVGHKGDEDYTRYSQKGPATTSVTSGNPSAFNNTVVAPYYAAVNGSRLLSYAASIKSSSSHTYLPIGIPVLGSTSRIDCTDKTSIKINYVVNSLNYDDYLGGAIKVGYLTGTTVSDFTSSHAFSYSDQNTYLPFSGGSQSITSTGSKSFTYTLKDAMKNTIWIFIYVQPYWNSWPSSLSKTLVLDVSINQIILS